MAETLQVEKKSTRLKLISPSHPHNIDTHTQLFSLVERRNMAIKTTSHKPKPIKPKEKENKKTKAENSCHEKLELEFLIKFLAFCAIQR